MDGAQTLGIRARIGDWQTTGAVLMNHLRELFTFSAKERRYYKLSMPPMLVFIAVMTGSALTVK